MPDFPPSYDDLPILRELGDDLKAAFRTARPASARRRVRVSLGAVATAFSVIVAVGVAVLAVALLGHSRRGSERTIGGASERQLVAQYGVLRRPPQDAADRRRPPPTAAVTPGRPMSHRTLTERGRTLSLRARQPDLPIGRAYDGHP
jgi:hypothetical protein